MDPEVEKVLDKMEDTMTGALNDAVNELQTATPERKARSKDASAAIVYNRLCTLFGDYEPVVTEYSLLHPEPVR